MAANDLGERKDSTFKTHNLATKKHSLIHHILHLLHESGNLVLNVTYLKGKTNKMVLYSLALNPVDTLIPSVIISMTVPNSSPDVCIFRALFFAKKAFRANSSSAGDISGPDIVNRICLEVVDM